MLLSQSGEGGGARLTTTNHNWKISNRKNIIIIITITHRFLVKEKRGKYRQQSSPVMKKTHSKCHSTLCKQLTFDTTLTKFILLTPSHF